MQLAFLILLAALLGAIVVLAVANYLIGAPPEAVLSGVLGALFGLVGMALALRGILGEYRQAVYHAYGAGCAARQVRLERGHEASAPDVSDKFCARLPRSFEVRP